MYFLIPILFLVSSIWLRFASGPFWLGLNNDPAYLYLMNSLYIADGKIPTFIQHPGTPVQLIGAGIIKVVSGFKSADALVEAVFRQPEVFLTSIWFAIIVLTTVVLFILGHVVYKSTHDKVAMWWVQSGIMGLFIMYQSLANFLFIPANVSAETLLMPCVIVYLIWLFHAYGNAQMLRQTRSVVLLGVLLGILIAIKVTCLPFLVMSLYMIYGWRNRSILLIATLVSALLATFPIWPQYAGVYAWLKGLMLYKGFHGSGDQGFIDKHVFINNGIVILKWQWFLVLMAISVLGLLTIKYRKFLSHQRRIIVTVCGIVLLSMVMVIKQPAIHYLGPAYMIWGVLVFAFATMIGIKQNLLVKVFYGWIVIVVLLIGSIGVRVYQESRAMVSFSEHVYSHYDACVIAGYYRSSSVNFALQFGDDNAGRKAYGEMIKKIYPQHVFYQLWDRRFDDSTGVVFAQTMKDTVPCIVLYGSLAESPIIKSPLFETKLLMSSIKEGVYEVINPVDRQARQALMLSKMAWVNNEYQASYILAKQAEQLGLPEASTIVKSIEDMIKKSQ